MSVIHVYVSYLFFIYVVCWGNMCTHIAPPVCEIVNVRACSANCLYFIYGTVCVYTRLGTFVRVAVLSFDFRDICAKPCMCSCSLNVFRVLSGLFVISFFLLGEEKQSVPVEGGRLWFETILKK